MSVVCLDTSAVLSVLFREMTADQVSTSIVPAERIFASRLLIVEAERAILRTALDDRTRSSSLQSMRAELHALVSTMTIVEVTRAICDAAARIAPRSRLRGMDAIHLATFQHIRSIAPAAQFITLDRRLLDALRGARG